MKATIFLLLTVSTLLIVSWTSIVYAESIFRINILEGSDNPDNQNFWQVTLTGSLQGILTITKGDSVMWNNQDTVEHTVTSGNPQEGPNGIFDSELFGQGETFLFEFTEPGEYPYYCTIHPWMFGLITVTEPYLGKEQVLYDIGKEFDEHGFNIEYTLEGILDEKVLIKPEEKSITFYYDPIESKEDVLIIRLPENLIDGIKFTLVDGEIIPEAIRENIGDITTMYVPLWPDSREITFVGEQIISLESSSGGGCLIATATYGSELSPQVQQLRELRDNKLLQTESGSVFMQKFNEFYYSFSPVIADYERENRVFKEAVKLAITPMISSLSIMNHLDMETDAEVLGYGISLILLNVGMYAGVPAIVVMGIRKKFQLLVY